MIRHALAAALFLAVPCMIAPAFAGEDSAFDSEGRQQNITHDPVTVDPHEGNIAKDSINGSEDIPTGAVSTDEVHTTSTGRIVKNTNQ